jgi:signal transduction histidine kinase
MKSRETSAPAATEPPSRPGPDAEALAIFFRSLAHDLRSPLGGISQVVAELRSDFAAELTDEHRLLISLADRSLLRLGRMAETMGLVAALEVGPLELRCHPVDLVELVRAAAATAVAIESRREVELTCELPEGACLVRADEVRLPFAISEIVINAIRHARRRSRVHVELAAGQARVIIEDDGQGLTEEARATLFRRFVAHRSRSGLGVGLSIAHDLIAAHGGQLTLDASTLPPGRPGTIGARFVVTLPEGSAGPAPGASC